MTILHRFSLSFASALLVAGITFVFASAGSASKVPEKQNQKLACSECHPKISTAWENGAHSHALSDTEFTQMWTDQGKPETCLECHVTGYSPTSGLWQLDGVACKACHSPIPTGHPMDQMNYPVPVDRSADLCGKCHNGSHFDVGGWQTSSHFTFGIACVECHDPHSATLKSVAGQEEDGPSALCMQCHLDISMNFPYSMHLQAGISCVDCHLPQVTPQAGQDVHSIPDHSFTASLESCNSCHTGQVYRNLQVHSSQQIHRTRNRQHDPSSYQQGLQVE